MIIHYKSTGATNEFRSPRKIHIIGSVGSGKTTLAKEMSKLIGATHFELDNVVWKRSPAGDTRRSDREKREILKDIIVSDTWIIEGTHTDDWIEDSLVNADLIILLDPAYKIRNIRIIKRFMFQKLKIEIANYTPSLRIFLRMFKWNRYFEHTAKPFIFDRFSAYGHKMIIVENKLDVIEYLTFLKRNSEAG
ncbi:DNA topology modulation protein FlaR [Terribacillus saccharophilus]|uniref:DNA topology modulation protein FlaR n=1 Tax=Terribacillus saccharophilus TaxID=361277 RepID=UPI000BA526CD|nr:DNA topology modulation protein FlaR [Terribacillus saccharophilus]PAF35799.1 DNA topology modulation protein FlaR [Terribacillus saccharophilus]